MWNYEKRLQYPVKITQTCPKTASLIISQFGGPDGELAASMRYLSQRFTMPNRTTSALLNDIGTEELSHLEMVSTIVHQLTRDLSMEEIEKSGFGPYYIDHTVGVWHRQQVAYHLMHVNFRVKVIRSLICSRILLQSKKPVLLMTIFSE